MHSSRPPRGGLPAALPALLRATHFFDLALGSALGKLRDSGVTAVVRAVVKTMELAGFGGNDLIARTLARAGWKLSA